MEYALYNQETLYHQTSEIKLILYVLHHAMTNNGWIKIEGPRILFASALALVLVMTLSKELNQIDPYGIIMSYKAKIEDPSRG